MPDSGLISTNNIRFILLNSILQIIIKRIDIGEIPISLTLANRLQSRYILTFTGPFNAVICERFIQIRTAISGKRRQLASCLDIRLPVPSIIVDNICSL